MAIIGIGPLWVSAANKPHFGHARLGRVVAGYICTQHTKCLSGLDIIM